MKELKSWFSFYGNGKYPSSEIDDVYFSNEEISEAKELADGYYPEILEELRNVIANNSKNIVPYYNRTLANKPGDWTVFTLRFWGVRMKSNSSLCPKTDEFLGKIPGVLSASFSILKPGVRINEHVGDSNTFYRHHLGLKIPDNENVFFKVKGQEKHWEEGELFAFCDAQKHVAQNLSDEDRWLLIFDVIRPQFESKKWFYCSCMLGTSMAQYLFQKFYFFKYLPAWSRKLLFYSFGVIIAPFYLLKTKLFK